MATVYAVASAKGGVGKTTTTAAIATILADSGADVVAIDADIGMANLAGAVGVTPEEPTLHDVLAGRADPNDAVHEGPAGLRVVPGSPDLDAYAAADPSGLKAVIDAFDDADYVFVDAGAGLSHDSTLPLGLADETLLVSTPERSALGDTEKTRQFAERIGGTVAGAAITRVAADTTDTTDDDVAEALDATVLGRVPEDEAVLQAIDASEPLPTFAPDAPSTRAYRDLTRALTGADVEGEGLAGGVAAGVDGSDDDESDEDESGEIDDADEEDESDEDVDGGDDTPEQPEPIGEAEAVEEPDADGESEAIPDADEEAGTADEGEEDDDPDEDDTEAVDEGGEDDEEHRDEPEEAVAESDAPGNGIADETETVGEEHVGAEDLEAMVEEDVGEAERFDAETDRSAGDEASTTDDETAAEADVDTDATDDEGIADAEAASSGSESDIDDELEGSVPFRGDDSDRVGTVRSDEDAETDGTDDEGEAEDEGGTDDETGAEGGDEPETEDEPENGNETEEETDDDSRGFFSRLLGR